MTARIFNRKSKPDLDLVVQQVVKLRFACSTAILHGDRERERERERESVCVCVCVQRNHHVSPLALVDNFVKNDRFICSRSKSNGKSLKLRPCNAFLKQEY
jgi:hypothetical protein